MQLMGSANQSAFHQIYDASGTLAANTPILALPVATSRSYLFIENTGSATIYVDFGGARATAVMAGTAPNQTVASVTVTNSGQGYTYPPHVMFMGGGAVTGEFKNSSYLGVGLPQEVSPTKPARATAALSSGSVSGVTIDDPGGPYGCAPYVWLINNRNDPNGVVATSATGGAGAISLAAGASLIFNGTICPTCQIGIVSGSTGSYTLKFMP